MKMTFKSILLGALACGGVCLGETFGWRQNWTGLFPDAKPPVEWGRISKGIVAGMTCATEPVPAKAHPLMSGFITDWMVCGPFATAVGEKVPGADASWKPLIVPKKADYDRWGTTMMEWVNFLEHFEHAPDKMAYAKSHLFCERAGKVTLVMDHAFGLKMWLNGEVVYSNSDRGIGFDNYVSISGQKKDLVQYHSPKFEITMKKGWNELLVQVTTDKNGVWKDMRFAARVYDSAPVYEEKNIVWMTALPERSNAAPLILGDKIFVTAEPDELLCLDKKTGKILWRAINGLYEATPEAERAAFKDEVEPLAQQLAKTTDFEKGLELRRQIRDALIKADAKKFKLKWDGHFESHFGIIGFSTTPVSDGKRVYAFFGYGVVACYAVDGKRQWIRRLQAKQLGYTCSPALSGGNLMCVFGGLHALDAATGEERWANPEASCIASIIPMRIGATDAVTLQGDSVYRAADGKLLWKNPDKGGGWGAPVFLDNKLYMLVLGVSDLRIADFTGCEGDEWKPKLRRIEIDTNHHRPNGEWLDRSSPASPLVWDGRCYAIDEYGVMYCADLETGKTLYKQDMGFDELHSYNHIGVAASPTLGGKNIYLMDNQGMCVVIEPGPTFKQVAVNHIETTLPRDWPMPPQEIIANGPPVFDGERVYIRGEQYLYCIGKKH